VRERILIVDDDRDLCELLSERLAALGYRVTWRLSAHEAAELIDQHDFDVILMDINIEGASGLELCARLRQNRPSTLVIMITAFGNMSAAVAAIRAGAYDFIDKPVDLGVLEHAIARASGVRSLREQLERLKRWHVPTATGLGTLIGTSRAMSGANDLIRRVAPFDTTVLLSGESGTGKEVVARALHDVSARSAMQFVGINCAAMPGELLESELFGHVRGAFTDAKNGRQGLFSQASGGTLLLDEIGEMPLEMQPKLLRVLQERCVRPVGANESFPVDVRIIAATNKDLEALVEQGRFREDLFYRLNVIQIHLPPLRARGNDILLLAEHFAKRFARQSGKTFAGIAPEAQRKLLDFDWPGNVRQLENSMQRAIALIRGEQIEVADLPDRVVEGKRSVAGADDVDLENVPKLDQIERLQLELALRRFKGNKTRAAKALGIDRRTLYRKLDRYDAAARKGQLDPGLRSSSAERHRLPANLDAQPEDGPSSAAE
jgi:DNA-binding NtrC family response regulator